jgi:hypothetical protein
MEHVIDALAKVARMVEVLNGLSARDARFG